MPLLSHYFIRLLVALLSGASATLAFAPYSLWPFAFIAPLILLLLMHKQTTKKATWLGFVWGLGYFGAGVSWVHVSIDNFGGMPVAASLFLMIGLISYLSLYPMLFSFLLQRFFLAITTSQSIYLPHLLFGLSPIGFVVGYLLAFHGYG